MPYVKSRDIRSTPLCSLKYICNPEKADGDLLVSAVNCMSDPKNAYEEMKRVYEFYSGRRFNEPIPESGKGKVKLIHYVQSFDPKEKISADVANRISLETVRKMFGENVQALVATHNDTAHIHTHFIINVYDLEGNRFYSNQKSLNKLKEISDAVCLQFGIQPYDKTQKPQPKISAYNEWEHKKKGTSWKQQIRKAIDSIIPDVKTLDELLAELERRGYTVKRGKYISVKAPEQQRFVRSKTLGDNYTEESLIRRISDGRFHNSYYNMCGSFMQRCGAYRFTKPAIETHDFYYGQYVTLVQEHLNSIDMVRQKLSEAVKAREDAVAAVNSANENYSEAKRIVSLAERYFNSMKGVQRIFPKSERDKAAVEVVKKYGLKSVEDIQSLKDRSAELAKELAAVRKNLTVASAEVKKYQDIVDTFDMMNSGEDYISRLVREARERCSLDEWYDVVHKNCEDIREEISQGSITVSGEIQRELAETILRLNGQVAYENEKLRSLIHYLAILRADNITTEKELAENIGRMKNSEKAADSDGNAIQRQARELRDDIHMAEIYLENKDRHFPNQEWLEECRRAAEKHGVYNMSGLERLENDLAELEQKKTAVDERKLFYYNKSRDYSGVRDMIANVRDKGYAERVIREEQEKERKAQELSKKKNRGR